MKTETFYETYRWLLKHWRQNQRREQGRAVAAMKPWSGYDWLVILLFAILVALFYWRILTPNLADRQSFPPGDFKAQFWAFATFEVRELSAGRLPLWNPYTFAGAPFWADVQSAVFYPPSLLTFVLSVPWGFSLFALEVEAVAHFWLAAVFMYLFLRRITQSRAGAALGTLTFTFSGYLTGYPSQQLAVLETVVWLPLILFFIHRAFTGWQVGSLAQTAAYPVSPALPSAIPALVLAGLTWGVALLAGHPQSALIVAYISCAYFLYLGLALLRLVRASLPASRRSLSAARFSLYLVIFLVTGLGLAAIQWLPAVEYTRLSVRAAGIYDKMAGGLPLIDSIQLLLPGLVSFYSPLYVGVVGLILAGWIAFTPGADGRHTTFWAVVAFIAFLISLGGNTFLYSPLYLIGPGFSIFRGQERWALAVAFSLSVLVAYGFKQFVSNQRQLTEPEPVATDQHNPGTQASALLKITRYLLILAIILSLASFYGLNDTGWTTDSPFYKLLGTATLLSLWLVLAWLLWNFSRRIQPGLLTILAGALIGLDLFTANWQTNLYPQLPEWHTQIPAVVAAIKADASRAGSPPPPYRVYNEFRLYDNYGIPFQIEDLWGASPLRPARYDQFLAPPMPIERTWELLNVKYVITWRKELYLPSTIIYEEPAGGDTTYVHRLQTVGPRAWLVNQAEIAPDQTLLSKIADPSFDRWHIALLEPGAEPFVKSLRQATPLPPISESANSGFTAEPGMGKSEAGFTSHLSPLTFHSPQSLAVEVSTPGPALLIFSETYYPGWQATVDGRPEPLLRADFVLRAVPIPPGQHQVALTFRPLSFRMGAIVTVLTLLMTAAALISLYLKSKKVKP